MKKESHTDLRSMWDKIDASMYRQNQGFKWGEQYLNNLIDELVLLKEKARKENNPYLYNQYHTSLIRAHEVQSEIAEKLKTSL